VKGQPTIALASIVALVLFAPADGIADEDPASADYRVVEIESDQLSIDPTGQEIVARGNVRIEVGDLELKSGTAIVDTASGTVELGPPFRLQLADVQIEGARLILSGPPLELEIDDPELLAPARAKNAIKLGAKSATCGAQGCQLVDAVGTGCAHDPTAYHVVAEQVTIHPAGDVDLERPVLYVGDTRVAALPWLRVRPPDAAGFLPPRIAWDARGGLILGPAGQIPLDDDLVLQGHAAVRTSQGFETSSTATMPAGRLTVDQLYAAPENHLRARYHLAPRLSGAALVVDGDLVDGRQIIDDLEFDPLERARTHTASRALLSVSPGDLVLTESRLEIVQGFDDRGQLDRALHTPVLGVTAELLPVAQAGPLWPGLRLGFTRRDTLTAAPAPGAAAGLAPEHSLVEAQPSLAHSGRMGPLVVDLEAGSLHRAWLPDRTADQRRARHLAAAAAQLRLPLWGNPGGVRHIVEPLLGYRVTPWIDGSEPSWVLDDLDRMRRGHGFEVGIENILGVDQNRGLAELLLVERFDLPGFGLDPGPAYTLLRAGSGPRWLRLTVEGSWDHRQQLPSDARIELATADHRGNSLATGAGWYGPGRGAHQDRAWGSTGGPWASTPWVTTPERALELSEKAALAITKRVRASAGARVGVVPDPRLHALFYGIELGSRCGCLVAGILASHRLGSWVPDMMATLSLHQI
jgi:hypothetical protein